MGGAQKNYKYQFKRKAASVPLSHWSARARSAPWRSRCAALACLPMPSGWRSPCRWGTAPGPWSESVWFAGSGTDGSTTPSGCLLISAVLTRTDSASLSSWITCSCGTWTHPGIRGSSTCPPSWTPGSRTAASSADSRRSRTSRGSAGCSSRCRRWTCTASSAKRYLGSSMTIFIELSPSSTPGSSALFANTQNLLVSIIRNRICTAFDWSRSSTAPSGIVGRNQAGIWYFELGNFLRHNFKEALFY